MSADLATRQRPMKSGVPPAVRAQPYLPEVADGK
jgi:hypothetical protein